MAMTVSRDNLPGQLTSIIGRQAELRALADLLADPACRLVTIYGPGGIGKTRLAIEAACRVARQFAAGVCFSSVPVRFATIFRWKLKQPT